MGMSLFTELKPSTNEPIELLETICRPGRHQIAGSCGPMQTHEKTSTKEYATFHATTWPMTSTAKFFTTETPRVTRKQTANLHDENKLPTTSDRTQTALLTTITPIPLLSTTSAVTTLSIHSLTTTRKNISESNGAEHAVTNTSNQFHVDVHVEQIVISSTPKSGHINDSSKSTEKLSKDEKGNTTSTKIWITVGVFLGRLKNDLVKNFNLKSGFWDPTYRLDFEKKRSFSRNKGTLFLVLLGFWIWSCHGTRYHR